MRNFFYAIVLVSLIVFGLYTSPKSFAFGQVTPPAEIKYPYKITEVYLSGDQKDTVGTSISTTSAEIIVDLGLAYYIEDKINAFPDLKLGIGSTIKIERAPVIKVKDGKKTTEYRSWSKTVEGLLAEKNIELGVDDKISASKSAQIFDGSSVVITRVAVTNIIEKKSIDFKVVKKEDPNLDKGKTRVEKAGVKGEKELTYQLTREDGVEVNRVLIDTKVTSEPKDQIEYFGTRPVITVRCKYNDTVLAAAIKYKQDANTICSLMMKESNGNPGSVNPNGYYGLFQYDLGLWSSASAKAGYSGADWSNPTAQIYTTCYLFSVGQSWRW